jgi:hypothetical protein
MCVNIADLENSQFFLTVEATSLNIFCKSNKQIHKHIAISKIIKMQNDHFGSVWNKLLSLHKFSTKTMGFTYYVYVRTLTLQVDLLIVFASKMLARLPVDLYLLRVFVSHTSQLFTRKTVHASQFLRL